MFLGFSVKQRVFGGSVNRGDTRLLQQDAGIRVCWEHYLTCQIRRKHPGGNGMDMTDPDGQGCRLACNIRYVKTVGLILQELDHTSSMV
jgi:hypothetical protein